MKIAYSHLVDNIKENPCINELSNKLFQLGHEHEIEGNIFNLELTPNRGDCLSLRGLLRDLSVFYTVNINQKIYSKSIDELKMNFENLSDDICPEISFLKLEIDKIPNSYNDVLNKYFVDLNLNKNNFFTDVSNYISYETGQPTHCYDAKKINGKLVFKEVNINQEFISLLDSKINLTGKNSVFLLEDKIVNLAGIIGDKSTSCSTHTKTVLVECAFFKPEAIIGKSIKYDIQSDASYKFERHVDPACHEYVLRRFINIVNEHTKINNMSMISYKYKDRNDHKISINVNKINQVLGVNLTEIQYLKYLNELGFKADGTEINVPSYRSDIKTQNDLAEEVARSIGYDNIIINNLILPKAVNIDPPSIEENIKFFLIDQGFYEIINNPFTPKFNDQSIKVDNPLDSNREYLRTSIVDSLIDNLIYNERRQKDSIKLFEISDIYTIKNNKINKQRRLGIIASGRLGNNYKDFSKKITLQHLTETFGTFLPQVNFNFKLMDRGSLNTKIKDEIVVCDLNLTDLPNEVLNYEPKTEPPKQFNQYLPISDLPYSKRDISFSVADYSKCKFLEDYMMNLEDPLLKEVFVFDYFFNEKNREIKIGFRLIFQSPQKTITDEEVDIVVQNIMNYTTKTKGINIPGYPS